MPKKTDTSETETPPARPMPPTEGRIEAFLQKVANEPTCNRDLAGEAQALVDQIRAAR